MLRRVLQHRHRFVPAIGALHSIRHQQEVVAVRGIGDQRPSVCLDGLVVEPAEAKDAGFEFTANAGGVECTQPFEPALDLAVSFVALFRQIVGKQVQDEVLHMLEFVGRVPMDQLPEHPVVARVVVLQPVDIGELPQPFDGLDLAGPCVLVDHLGRRQRVPHIRVDPYQEIHLVAVRLAGVDLVFEFHHDVGQGVRLRRQEQKLVLRDTAPGRTVDADPKRPPGVESVFFPVGKAVEPRQAHALVVAEAVLLLVERFESLECGYRPVHSLVGVRQVPHRRIVRRQMRLHAVENRQRIVVPTAFETRVEHEQQAVDVFTGCRHPPLDHRHGLFEETHAHHLLARRHHCLGVIGVRGFEVPPDCERILVAGKAHVVRCQPGIPIHDVRFRRHQAAVFADHVVGPAGSVVETDQPSPGLKIDSRAFARACLIEGDGIVVAPRLDQEINPQFVQHRATLRPWKSALEKRCARAVDGGGSWGGRCGWTGGVQGVWRRQPVVVAGGKFRAGVDIVEKIGEAVLLPMGLHEQRQRVAGVGLRSRRFEGEPGMLLRHRMGVRRKRPLREPDVLRVRRMDRTVHDAVEAVGQVGMSEDRQGNRGAIAERLIAPCGKFDEGFRIVCPGLGHGEAKPDELRLVLPLRCGERTFVEGHRRLDIARDVEETPLEE